MRSIWETEKEADAKLLGDYLFVQGIRNDVDEDDGTWGLWIHDDDQLEAAEAEVADFLENPANPKYRKLAKRAQGMREAEAADADRAHKRQVDVRTQVFNSPGLGTPLLTYLMIGVCLMTFLLQLQDARPNYLKISNYGPKQVIETTNLLTGEVVNTRMHPSFLPEITGRKVLVGREFESVGIGEIWRLVTPIFLHFGLMHILFNMYMLYILGGLLEGRLGLGYMLGFVIFTATFSNLGQYLVSGYNFGGMSGVNYALFGYLWLRGKNDPGFGIQLDQGTIIILMAWFVLCFTGMLGNIANTAHAIGLISGAGMGWIAAQRAR